MKPSEWIEQNKLIKGKQLSSIWSDLKELDKRFIDKEELKFKIDRLYSELYYEINLGSKPKNHLELAFKEILKLLEE